MQKQPYYAIEFAPIPLDPTFPFSVSPRFTQHDQAITKLHAHDVPELGYCLAGNGVFVVGNKVMPFQSGDSIVIMPGELHLAQSVKGTVSHWHWLYFEPARLLHPAAGAPALFDFSRFHGPAFHNLIGPATRPELVRLVKAMVETGLGRRPFRHECLTALLCLFAAELQTAFPALPAGPGAGVDPRPELLRRLNAALQQLSRHYRDPLRLDRLAARCHLSPTHFRRLFRQATGSTPLAYLHQIRIGMAMAELRRGERAIGDLALACGFVSLSSFNRQFKRQTGLAPRDWRKNGGAPGDT